MDHHIDAIKILGVSSVPRDRRMDFKKRLPEEVITRLHKRMFFFQTRQSLFYYFDFIIALLAQTFAFLRHARKMDCILCFVPQLLPFALLSRRPVIFIAVDDYEGDVYTRKLKKWVFRFIKRFFVVQTHLVICTTQYIADRYSSIMPSDKIRVIRVGVDCDYFTPARSFVPFQSSNKKKAILYYHGKLREDYNTGLLLKALTHMEQPATLWLAGDGPQQETLKQLAQQARIQDRVRFWGKTPFEELPALMEQADIFLNPISILGSKLYQYFSAMRPVVSLCGLVNELARNEVEFLCVNKDPKEFAKAIDRLLLNPQLQKKLVLNARKRIESQDWSKILSKYQKAIIDAIP
ncbi:MAG: glycosyltransferase family 4 protein [Candidatus Hodarchaeota archaeon]